MKSIFTTCYLGLGSSVGDRLANLQAAIDMLHTPSEGMEVIRISPVYESPHLGLQAGDSQRYPAHLNAVVCVNNCRTPQEMLARVHFIEEVLGRTRTERWAPRTIDIDILLFGDECVDTPDLHIPHIEMTKRAFVMLPLTDIATELRTNKGREKFNLSDSEDYSTQAIHRTDYALSIPLSR